MLHIQHQRTPEVSISVSDTTRLSLHGCHFNYWNKEKTKRTWPSALELCKSNTQQPPKNLYYLFSPTSKYIHPIVLPVFINGNPILPVVQEKIVVTLIEVGILLARLLKWKIEEIWYYYIQTRSYLYLCQHNLVW